MAFSMFLIVTLIIILLIWFFIEIKRAKHKIFAIALIILIVFLYFSVTYIFKDKPVDYKSVNGISDATKLYFNWLGYFYNNAKTITNNAIKMNWKGNISTDEVKTPIKIDNTAKQIIIKNASKTK